MGKVHNLHISKLVNCSSQLRAVKLHIRNILCCLYSILILQIESVELALKLLDDANFKGKQIKVEKVTYHNEIA